jgi:hypothetical protein
VSTSFNQLPLLLQPVVGLAIFALFIGFLHVLGRAFGKPNQKLSRGTAGEYSPGGESHCGDGGSHGAGCGSDGGNGGD